MDQLQLWNRYNIICGMTTALDLSLDISRMNFRHNFLR
jgi:hypothetical protein